MVLEGKGNTTDFRRGGGLELIDEPRGVGEREFLGAGDAEVAEQAVEVGVLATGDGEDRPHLAGRGGLADPGRVGGKPWGGLAVGGVDAVVVAVGGEGFPGLGRVVCGLEPGQLVIHGLLGGVEGIADLVAEAGRIAEQTALDLEIEVAAGADRRVGRQAELLGDADVESQGHGDVPCCWRDGEDSGRESSA